MVATTDRPPQGLQLDLEVESLHPLRLSPHLITDKESPDMQTMQFDPTRAFRYDPNKVLKVARIIEKPDGQESVIDAEWGEKQTFVGTYVEVLDPNTGQVTYGSGYQEWMNTNAPWEGVENGWYKCTPIDAYQADTEGDLITVLASGVVETTKHVNPGDWLVRQRDGEVMCVSAPKFPVLYDVTTGRPLSKA